MSLSLVMRENNELTDTRSLSVRVVVEKIDSRKSDKIVMRQSSCVFDLSVSNNTVL